MADDQRDVRLMSSMPVGSGDDRGGMSVAGKVIVAVLVVIVVALVGMVAFFAMVLGTPDRDTVPTIGSASLAQRPTLEEYHAELWPLGHELVRQLEAATGVTFTIDTGPSGRVRSCSADQGWMENSTPYVGATIDIGVLEAVGRQVLAGLLPTYSTYSYTSGETLLQWSNDEGSRVDVWILRDTTTSVGWSSGCALSSVYPPPYTKPWPSGLPSPPTPLPDPEAPTVTVSPSPSGPIARPTPTSSPS